MSTTRIKTAVLALLGASGAIAAVYAIKPSRTAGIADTIRSQLDQDNTQFEHDRANAKVDQAEYLKDIKRRKPWRETEEEREAMKKTGDGDWRLRNEGE